MFVLGIETTCDETAASVVRRSDDGRGEIISNVVLSQTTHMSTQLPSPARALALAVNSIRMNSLRSVIEANLRKAHKRWRRCGGGEMAC